MTKFRTHYDNLKVARDAPDFVIRAAYKTLSQKYHPDKNPGNDRATEVMAVINKSYEVLSDPGRRREHDEWIALEEARLRPQATSHPREPQAQQAVRPERSLFVRTLMVPVILFGKLFIAAPQLVLLVLLLGGVWLWDSLKPDRPPAPGPKPYQAEAPARPASVPDRPAYVRPSSAPNGSPWPGNAGYVKGYSIDNDAGYSEVTVDNGQNDSDVFVKLVSLDEETAFPVRQFYIPAGSRFKMNKVTAGKYDIRYRDLNSGGLSRSESFEITETRTDEGIEYSGITMTLYKVEGGNFQTYDLADGEF